jgi:uncharacterized protein
MLQLIVLLAISWMLIWLFEKSNLEVLGILPTKKRIKYFLLFLAVSSLIAASAFLLRTIIAKETYSLSTNLSTQSILYEVLYQFRTVLTEELICRGVLLYWLIKKTGVKKAVLISSLLFAVLHLFNSGVWGNVVNVILLFLFTFLMGLLLAYAYAKTFTIYLPFAIHLGWNIIQNYVFPGSTNGNHIFYLAAEPPTITISYFAFGIMFLLPKILLLVINYFIIKQLPKAGMP